jgi:PIN domain nuclease of toxin-antitoxin system
MAQQAKLTIKYKTTKLQLLKTNAAIWFNKMCRGKHLTPKYINIKISGHNRQAQHTKSAATRIRINQEIKFLYRKKGKR